MEAQKIETKFCKDCKHHKPLNLSLSNNGFGDECLRETSVNKITGETEVGMCSVARIWSCGRDAKNFESKVSP